MTYLRLTDQVGHRNA